MPSFRFTFRLLQLHHINISDIHFDRKVCNFQVISDANLRFVGLGDSLEIYYRQRKTGIQLSCALHKDFEKLLYVTFYRLSVRQLHSRTPIIPIFIGSKLGSTVSLREGC